MSNKCGTHNTYWYVIFGMLLALAGPAQAMSYLPMADAPLLQQADTVVLGEVNAVAAAPGHELDATRYTLNVEQVLKGATAASIGVLVPGALDSSRPGALTIPGMPHIQAGERVLAFLEHRADGNYVLVHLSLGAFHVRATVSGASVLVRDLEQADILEQATNPAAAQMAGQRDLVKFSGWLRQQAAGQKPAADYWNAEALAPVQQPRYLLSSPAARWFQFDNGGSVPFYAYATGQSGLAGGGYAQFQQAIAAWNNSGVAKVNYSYAGVTSASGDLNNPDGVNKILFNDITSFIGGIFDCVTGGIAGYGGWRSASSQTFNGVTYQAISEADISIRNGAGCLLSGNNGSTATELFAHELGHTLGLAHPCGDPSIPACVSGSPQDQAIMRPYVHADGRGAALAPDDLQGLALLYPRDANTGTGGNLTGSTGTGGSGTGSAGGSGGGSFNWLAGVVMALGWGMRRRVEQA